MSNSNREVDDLVPRLSGRATARFGDQEEPGVEISIILPVYNGAEYLGRAIDSMLAQTFTDFELIILNDGSTDGSQAVIDSYNDARIVAVSHKNMGLHRTLNKGLEMARGKYICRMDQDDTATPERLEKQKRFLDEHPEVGLVGSESWLVGLDGKVQRLAGYASEDREIRWFLLFDNPMIHSSVVFRKELAVACGGYEHDQKYNLAEDYDLWSRMSWRTRIHNLNAPLVTRVVVPGVGMSFSNLEKQLFQAQEVSMRNCEVLVGAGSAAERADLIILRSAWLGSPLPNDILPYVRLRRLPRLVATAKQLFQGVYKDYSIDEKSAARKWLSGEYREKLFLAPPVFTVVTLRLVLLIYFQPGNLLSLRFYAGTIMDFLKRLVKYGLGRIKRQPSYAKREE